MTTERWIDRPENAAAYRNASLGDEKRKKKRIRKERIREKVAERLAPRTEVAATSGGDENIV